jgi:hypothetical protein
MSTMRQLTDIRADIAAAAARLALLERERRFVLTERRTGIVADFDSGMDRADIAAKWGVDYGQVAAVLHRAHRTERTRRAQGLNDVQLADYNRLLRQGVGTRCARAIALRGP